MVDPDGTCGDPRRRDSLDRPTKHPRVVSSEDTGGPDQSHLVCPASPVPSGRADLSDLFRPFAPPFSVVCSGRPPISPLGTVRDCGPSPRTPLARSVVPRPPEDPRGV